MLLVSDLMTPNPKTVDLDTPLRRILEIMKEEAYRQLPVMDGDQLAGIVTDRDVRLVLNSPMVWHRPWEQEQMLNEIRAEEFMTPSPLTVAPETPADEAADMLATYKFGALPVVDNGRLVGIITVSDFLDYFIALGPRLVAMPTG